MNGEPRLALMTCVRNEARWLPAFLKYHHAIGIERAYVFCDRCTDGSDAVAALFPWVKVLRLDESEAAAFPYIADLHTACMNHALTLARQERFDWLLLIDVDEFAHGDQPGPSAMERAQLQPLVRHTRPETVQIRLTTREVVPMRATDAAPFWRQRFFQAEPRLTWSINDPLTGQSHSWSKFLGHREGKTLVRVAADVQGFDSHRWVPQQGVRWPVRPEFVDLPTEEKGFHLHYFLTDERHWLEKFRKQASQPDVWICGTEMELPKLCWKKAISQLPADRLNGYFDRAIARPEAELTRLAAMGTIGECTDIIDILAILGETEPARFNPVSGNHVAGRERTGWGWHAAEMPTGDREGFHALERYGSGYFRWTQPNAAVRLQLPVGDYRLRVDMKDLHHLWANRMDVACDDRPIPCRDRVLENGMLHQIIRQQDLPSDNPFWLKLAFDPIQTEAGSPDTRLLGAPIFSVFMERV